MPELISCPSCKSSLRVPAGAEAIRCPQCKTVVPLKAAPLPMARPLPLDDAGALPLPTKLPQTVPAPLPAAKALPLDKPVIRGSLVRDEDEARDADRPRKPPVDKKDYGELEDQCRYARIAVQIMAFGAVCGAIMSLGFAIYLSSIAVASSVILSLYYIVIAALVLQTLLFCTGFGFALAGPRDMRPTAAVGLVTTLIYAGLTMPLLMYGVHLSDDLVNEGRNEREMPLTSAMFFIGAGPSNLCGLTDIPWLLVQGELDKPWYVVMIVIGGLLEFWRVSILGMLVQFYAAEGKSVELGFQSLRFVYRIIWIVIIALSAKLLALFAFRMMGGEPMIASFFKIPQTLITDAYYMWWTFTWFSQYQTMKDVVEIILPHRFASKQLNLDAY